jgi:hypothetical protein
LAYTVIVLSTDDHRRVRFWQPDTPSVTGMLRVEREDRARITYAEHFTVVAVYEGAFDGWYRGRERTHVAGSLKLKEPGEVHRDLRVHAPFTLQGAGFAPELVAAAADAMGMRSSLHFKAPSFGPGERATRLAFAMHDALVREDAPRSSAVLPIPGTSSVEHLEQNWDARRIALTPDEVAAIAGRR